MDKYAKVKMRVHRMSKVGVADATISKIAGVSVWVVKGILSKKGYIPTPRIISKIHSNFEEFLTDLQ